MGLFKGFIKQIIKKVTKLSRPTFSLIENELVFKIDSDNFYKYQLQNIEIKTRHDSYVLDAYTLNCENLYLEYIHLDQDVEWAGLSYPYYLELLKKKLAVRNIVKLEEKEFGHYTFYTYEINNKYIINIIHIYEINKDIFILDKKSDLYIQLIKQFDLDYKYNFDKTFLPTQDINFSLVKNNSIQNYFCMQGGEG